MPSSLTEYKPVLQSKETCTEVQIFLSLYLSLIGFYLSVLYCIVLYCTGLYCTVSIIRSTCLPKDAAGLRIEETMSFVFYAVVGLDSLRLRKGEVYPPFSSVLCCAVL
jgi:hypothetical protein